MRDNLIINTDFLENIMKSIKGAVNQFNAGAIDNFQNSFDELTSLSYMTSSIPKAHQQMIMIKESIEKIVALIDENSTDFIEMEGQTEKEISNMFNEKDTNYNQIKDEEVATNTSILGDQTQDKITGTKVKTEEESVPKTEKLSDFVKNPIIENKENSSITMETVNRKTGKKVRLSNESKLELTSTTINFDEAPKVENYKRNKVLENARILTSSEQGYNVTVQEAFRAMLNNPLAKTEAEEYLQEIAKTNAITKDELLNNSKYEKILLNSIQR